jgi:hypothetical protein
MSAVMVPAELPDHEAGSLESYRKGWIVREGRKAADALRGAFAQHDPLLTVQRIPLVAHGTLGFSLRVRRDGRFVIDVRYLLDALSVQKWVSRDGDGWLPAPFAGRVAGITDIGMLDWRDILVDFARAVAVRADEAATARGRR